MGVALTSVDTTSFLHLLSFESCKISSVLNLTIFNVRNQCLKHWINESHFLFHSSTKSKSNIDNIRELLLQHHIIFSIHQQEYLQKSFGWWFKFCVVFCPRPQASLVHAPPSPRPLNQGADARDLPLPWPRPCRARQILAVLLGSRRARSYHRLKLIVVQAYRRRDDRPSPTAARRVPVHQFLGPRLPHHRCAS